MSLLASNPALVTTLLIWQLLFTTKCNTAITLPNKNNKENQEKNLYENLSFFVCVTHSKSVFCKSGT